MEITKEMSPSNYFKLIWPLPLILFFANIIFIFSFPVFGGDEVYYAWPGYNLWKHGSFDVRQLGDVFGFTHSNSWHTPVTSLIQYVSICIFGPTIFSIRIFTFIASAILLIVLAKIFNLINMAGFKKSVFFGCLLICGSPSFCKLSLQGRPDIYACLFFSLGFYCQLKSSKFTEEWHWPVFCSGFFYSLSILCHPIFFVFISTLILSHIFFLKSIKKNALFSIAFIFPLLLWLSFCFYNYNDFRDQFLQTSKFITTNNKGVISEIYNRLIVPNLMFPPLIFIYFFVTIILAWNIIRRHFDYLLTSFVIAFLLQFFYFSYRVYDTDIYLVYYEVAFSIAFAFCYSSQSRWRHSLLMILLFLISLNFTASFIYRTKIAYSQASFRNYGNIIETIKDKIPKNARVLGYQSLWLACENNTNDFNALLGGEFPAKFVNEQYLKSENLLHFDYIALSPPINSSFTEILKAKMEGVFEFDFSINDGSPIPTLQFEFYKRKKGF